MDNRGREPFSAIVSVELSDEELAAVEGWRRANDLDSHSAAVRQLVRLGLLNEIGRIYQSVTNNETHE